MLTHVMAPKEGGRTDEFDEFHCSAAEPWAGDDPDIAVVYHEEARLADDEWRCPCGISTEMANATFVYRLLS